MPEHKRLKYFLDQFVNYWLFCNHTYEQFENTFKDVKERANQKLQFETNIRIFRKRNEELKVDKANIAMKSQKLKDKLAQDKAKVEKLSEDVSAFNHQTAQVIFSMKVKMVVKCCNMKIGCMVQNCQISLQIYLPNVKIFSGERRITKL